jgi:hypothetical protein
MKQPERGVFFMEQREYINILITKAKQKWNKLSIPS